MSYIHFLTLKMRVRHCGKGSLVPQRLAPVQEFRYLNGPVVITIHTNVLHYLIIWRRTLMQPVVIHRERNCTRLLMHEV
jgi:hypothetical protein